MSFYDDVHKVSKLMKGYKPDTGSKEKDAEHRKWMKTNYPAIKAKSQALKKKKGFMQRFKETGEMMKRIDNLK